MSAIIFCRLCANLTKPSNSENLFEHCQQKLLQQAEELTGMQLKHTDNLPQYICIPCQAQTMQAHEFRESCIKAQEYFNTAEYRKPIRQHTDNTAVKQENIEYDDTESEDTENEEIYGDGGDFLMPIEELILKKKTAIANNQSDLNLSTDDGQAISSRREKKVKLYICDQCGKHLKNSTVLKEHLDRHAGIKKFGCHCCPKKFTTNQEMKLHLRCHTLEKPIPCRYCGERFSTCSKRATHERRIHTNERNHACNQCDKSFAQLAHLKSHLLKHTGERPFECKCCKLSYRTKKHLRQHIRSLRHKTNVEHEENNAPEKIF